MTMRRIGTLLYYRIGILVHSLISILAHCHISTLPHETKDCLPCLAVVGYWQGVCTEYEAAGVAVLGGFLGERTA